MRNQSGFLTLTELPPSIMCPHCRTGIGKWEPEWLDHERRTCLSCGEEFDRAAAIDEAFVEGRPEGIARWVGGVHVAGVGKCWPGESVLLDVRGRVERVFRLVAGGSGSCLAGGVKAAFIPQGFIMVAVAPDLDGDITAPVDVLVQAAGASASDEPLPAYKSALLEARAVALEAPKLCIILCVTALDLYFESLSGSGLTERRPRDWDRHLSLASGRTLEAVLEGCDYEGIRALTRVRNAAAHTEGDSYTTKLPGGLREAEARFLAKRHGYEELLSPAAKWALSLVLRVMRLTRPLSGASAVA